MLEARVPIDAAPSIPSAVVLEPSGVDADSEDPCHVFREPVPAPEAPARQPQPSATTRKRSMPAVDGPDAAGINARVGVLIDGRRFRMTLD
jgi:hypothetical protein